MTKLFSIPIVDKNRNSGSISLTLIEKNIDFVWADLEVAEQLWSFKVRGGWAIDELLRFSSCKDYTSFELLSADESVSIRISSDGLESFVNVSINPIHHDHQNDSVSEFLSGDRKLRDSDSLRLASKTVSNLLSCGMG